MNRSSRRDRSGAAFLVAGVLLCAACGGDRGAPRNVLLILVDTLRTDHSSTYGYARDTSPALSRLAAGGVRFDRAYAPSSWTKPSVASIFTGQYPHRHGLNFVLATLPDSAQTLAERLSQAGFATAGAVSHVFVDRKNGFDQGFDVYDSAEARGHSHVSTAGVTKRARKLLEQLAGGDRPFFLFVHYFDPHYEYRRHPEVGFAGESGGRLRGGEDIHELRAMGPSLAAEEVAFLRDVYDEEVRFTDAGIGELLDTLADLGLDPPVATVEVAALDGQQEFRLDWGLPVSEDATRSFARVGEQIFETSTPLAEYLVSSPEEWRSLALTTFETHQIDSIRVLDDQGELTLQRAGADWMRDDDRISFTAVSELLYALVEARAARVEGSGEIGVGRADAGDTDLEITLSDGERQEILSLGPLLGGGLAARSSEREAILVLDEAVAGDIGQNLGAVRAAEPLGTDDPAPATEDLDNSGDESRD